MILMSDIRDSSMVEKGPKNSDTPPTPPYSGNARKKTFFHVRCSFKQKKSGHVCLLDSMSNCLSTNNKRNKENNKPEHTGKHGKINQGNTFPN